MPPIYLLGLLCLLTAAAMALDRVRRRRIQRALRELASQKQMHFSLFDRLRLTQRVAQALPVPGAAAVRVFDLLYHTDAGRHRYIFTVEYTVGVVQSKHRLRRAAAFSEPRQQSMGEPATPIRLAPPELSLLEQYRYLLE